MGDDGGSKWFCSAEPEDAEVVNVFFKLCSEYFQIYHDQKVFVSRIALGNKS